MQKMYFYGDSNKKGFVISILLVFPEWAHIPISVKLDFEVANNVAEYEACIIGLQDAIEIGVKNLQVCRNSN